MRRPAEWMLLGAAALVAACFLAGVLGVTFGGRARTDGPDRPGEGFHGGRADAAVLADPACQEAGCHDPYPHRRNKGTSAFLNMHRKAADCLACHGKDAMERWSAGKRAEGNGQRIASSIPPPGAGKDRHAVLGTPLSCRACHSGSGREALRTKGITELPAGFADPLALRMIEGGTRSWVPADLR